MDTVYSIRGLQAKHGFYKSVHKGEDTWTQKPSLTVPADSMGNEGDLEMAVYGIFDGHGGKQAANFASRNLTDKLLAALGDAPKSLENEEPDSTTREELRSCSRLEGADWALWRGQDRVIDALPAALVSAFQRLQADFFEQCKESGTTATLASLVGWELVVANVGDSSAFLDTGSEVLQVSGNHRLDDNKSEQERIKGQGYEVSSSRVEGRPCGPLRVWPGGLAMGRTLGDFDAGDIVLCDPEVRQVTLPASGGRVIIASDGLWDAVAPKTAAHHVRGMPATKASRELGQAALKAKGLRDDITVLVIDFVPSDAHRMPPLLAKDGSGNLQASSAPVPPVNVYHPLEDGEVGRAAWRQMQWSRRLEAVRLALPEEEPPHKLQTRGSESLSLESCCTPMVSSTSHDVATDGPPSDSDSGDSDTTAAHLANNPYALVEEHQDGESTWEKVPTKPAKSRAVPDAGRKHALPHSQGSPSEPWQVPKALKEAPPSPGFSPMLSSELGSSEPRDTQQGQAGGRRGGRGQGRGRGRGRAGGSAGRGFRPKPAAPRVIHVDGFALPHTDVQAPAPPGGFQNGGLSFLEGGGFSFELPAGSHPVTGDQSTASGAPLESASNDRPRRGRRPQQRIRGNPRPGGEQRATGAGGDSDAGLERVKQPEQRRRYRPRRQPTQTDGSHEHSPNQQRQQGGRRQGKGRQEGGEGRSVNNCVPSAPVV